MRGRLDRFPCICWQVKAQQIPSLTARSGRCSLARADALTGFQKGRRNEGSSAPSSLMLQMSNSANVLDSCELWSIALSCAHL